MFITDHRVNPANDKLVIEVIDEKGSGGAHHRYDITGFDSAPTLTQKGNPSRFNGGFEASFSRTIILFQNGPINEVGVNGITHEALLAIVAHRMKSFQDGPFACKENEMALQKVEEALMWMHKRTLKRMNRGVEGTHKV